MWKKLADKTWEKNRGTDENESKPFLHHWQFSAIFNNILLIFSF
jgi:hypothetical protein